MKTVHKLQRPHTLIVGNKYYLKILQGEIEEPSYIFVEFISYSPCPAFVKIRSESGRILKVSREDLFDFYNGLEKKP